MPDKGPWIEIESQLAHLSRHLEVLDEVVVQQGKEQKRLDQLLRRIEARLARIEAGIESDRKPLGDEPEASPWKDPEM